MFPAPRQPAGTLVLAVTALLGGLLLAWLRMLRRAVAAYAYLWPLVLMERTRLQVAPSANEFAHMLEFPDSAFRAVVNPNVDTLYSSAWLDVVGPGFYCKSTDEARARMAISLKNKE